MATMIRLSLPSLRINRWSMAPQRFVEVGQCLGNIVHSRESETPGHHGPGLDDRVRRFLNKQQAPMRETSCRVEIRGIDKTANFCGYGINQVACDFAMLFPVSEVFGGLNVAEFED